jgi:hypothetical protein
MRWKGYGQGYADGIEKGRIQVLQDFERVLAVCREELSDVRRDRDLQMQRADTAADLLLHHLGAKAISLVGQQEEAASRARQLAAVQTLANLPDPTEDLPYSDPRGTYRSARDASLFADGEDVSSAEG